MGWIGDLFGRKDKGGTGHSGGTLGNASILLSVPTQAIWTGRDYHIMAHKGFIENVVVYKCVQTIARCAASIPLKVKINDKDAPDDHPIVASFRRANPRQSGQQFRQSLHAYWQLGGDGWQYRIGADDWSQIEYYAIRPDRVKIISNQAGVPTTFQIGVTQFNRLLDVPIDPETLHSDLLQLTHFHPLLEWVGLSPLQPALKSMDVFNAATEWNCDLLQRNAMPGAVLKASTGSPNLTKEQIDELEIRLNAFSLGGRRRGSTMIMEGGMDYEAVGLTPQELQYIEGRRDAARDICNAFGVPPMVLGIPGDNTYSNQQEARASLWEDTVIPAVQTEADALTAWWEPIFPGIQILPDIETIPALHYRRDGLWSRTAQAQGFLEINEQRAMLGFDPVEGGDQILIPATLVPLQAMPFEGDIYDPADDETGDGKSREMSMARARREYELAYGIQPKKR